MEWLKHGDNRIGDIPSSNPLSIWTSKDIKEYISQNDLKLAEVYNMGYERTGCIFCMFGIMQDHNRFLLLKKTHPKLHEYCMRTWEDGGLGMKEVLEFMKIPTGCGQCNLSEFTGGGGKS
jgi:3'-phosphoadenosine 5'-phosphosulfate sulfotransferase (PAPS reductase)/FAD synthetase